MITEVIWDLKERTMQGYGAQGLSMTRVYVKPVFGLVTAVRSCDRSSTRTWTATREWRDSRCSIVLLENMCGSL